MLRFGLFPVRIGKLADEVKRITAFLPGFGDVGADGACRSTYLIRQRISLLLWEGFTDFEDFSLQF